MSSESDVIEYNPFSVVCPCCSTILVVYRSALPAPQHHSDPQRDETGWWFSCSQCNYRWWYRSDFLEESPDSHEKIETIQTLKRLLNEFADDSSETFSFSSTPPFAQSIEQPISPPKQSMELDRDRVEETKQSHSHTLDDSSKNQSPAFSTEINETIIQNIKTQILSEVKTELDIYQKSIRQQANIKNPLFDPKIIPSHIRKIGSAFFPPKKTLPDHQFPQNRSSPKNKYSYKRVLPSNFSVQNVHLEKPADSFSQVTDSSNAEPLAHSKKKSIPFSKILSSLKRIHLSSPFHSSSKASPLHPSPVLSKTSSSSDMLPETDETLPHSNPSALLIEPDIHQNAPVPSNPKIKVPNKNTVITYSNFKANISDTSFRKYPLFSLIDDKPVHFIKKEINIQTYSTYPKQIVQSPKKKITSSLNPNEFKKNALATALSIQTQSMKPQANEAPTLDPLPLDYHDDATVSESYEQPLQQEPSLEADPIKAPEIPPKKKSLFSWWRARKSTDSLQAEALDSSPAPVTSEPVVDEPILAEEPAIAEIHEQPLQQEPSLEADPIRAPEIPPKKKSLFSWWRARKSTDSLQAEALDSSPAPVTSEPVVDEPILAEEPAIAEIHEQPLQQEPSLEADPIKAPELPAKKQRIFTFSLDPFLKKKYPPQIQSLKSITPRIVPPQNTSEKIITTNSSHQSINTISLPSSSKTSPFKPAPFHFSSSIFLKKKRKPKVSIELRANHLSTILDPLPKLPESISLSNQTSKRIKVALRSNIESKLTQNIKPYIAIKEQSQRPIVIPFEKEETIVLPPLIPTLHYKKQEMSTQKFSPHLLKTIDYSKLPSSKQTTSSLPNALKTVLFMIGLSFITTGAIFITDQYKEIGLELWKRHILYSHSRALPTSLLLKEATYTILEGNPTNKLLIMGEVTNPNDHSAKMRPISIKVYSQKDPSNLLYSWNYFHFTTHILPKEHILFRTEKDMNIPLNADLHIEVELIP